MMPEIIAPWWYEALALIGLIAVACLTVVLALIANALWLEDWRCARRERRYQRQALEHFLRTVPAHADEVRG